jgi:hypothetical protein
MSIRAAEQRDAETYANWLTAAADINLADPEVYKYPTCNTVVVERKGEAKLMNSFHLVLMVEALAPKPDISPMDEARALKELFGTIEEIAKASGVREVWFGCKDPRVEKFVQRHGIEEVPYKMFRKRV